MKIALIIGYSREFAGIGSSSGSCRRNEGQSCLEPGRFHRFWSQSRRGDSSLMKKIKAVSIIGNYDQTVLKVPKKSEEWKDQKVPEKWFSFHWSFEHLSKKSIEYLNEPAGNPERNIQRLEGLVHPWQPGFSG